MRYYNARIEAMRPQVVKAAERHKARSNDKENENIKFKYTEEKKHSHTKNKYDLDDDACTQEELSENTNSIYNVSCKNSYELLSENEWYMIIKGKKKKRKIKEDAIINSNVKRHIAVDDVNLILNNKVFKKINITFYSNATVENQLNSLSFKKFYNLDKLMFETNNTPLKTFQNDIAAKGLTPAISYPTMNPNNLKTAFGASATTTNNLIQID